MAWALNWNPRLTKPRAILRARRHDLPGRPDSFAAETNASFLSIWANLQRNVLYCHDRIAAISLIVGGIVIMNIMLVSVTSVRARSAYARHRRASPGCDDAVPHRIWNDGIGRRTAGSIVWITVAKGITAIIGMPSAIKLWAVAAGLIVSASVGVFFGVYPSTTRSSA